MGVPSQSSTLHSACGNPSHTPGSDAHPDWSVRDILDWTRNIKVQNYRVWWSCVNGACTWTAPGANGKGTNKGAGKGKGKQGKGKGKGKGKIGKGGKAGSATASL